MEGKTYAACDCNSSELHYVQKTKSHVEALLTVVSVYDLNKDTFAFSQADAFYAISSNFPCC